jgi:YD repeat-containing protein
MNSHAIGIISFLALVFSASCGEALTTDYFYDSAGRLVRAEYDSEVSITYAYDLSGNLIQRQVYNEPVNFGRLQVSIVPETAQWRRTATALWRASGTWEENVPAGTYAVEFSVVPGWDTQTGEQVSLNAGEARALTVNFTANGSSYPVAATSKGGGMVTGAGTYLHNDLVQLSAQPGSGYRFLNWQDQDGQILSTDPTIEFRALSGQTFYACFVPRSLPGVSLLLMED